LSEGEKVKRIEIFRFRNSSGEWKKLYLEPTQGGAFLVISQGKKDGKSTSISFKLSYEELSFLRMAIDKLVLKYLEI